MRTDWDTYFLNIAQLCATRSTCIRAQHGAVVVRDKTILSTGYNGAPRGLQHCNEIGLCYREANHITPGTQYERCKSVHAEQNAIAQAARNGIALIDSTIYVTDLPCGICAKLIVNAGIQKVVYLGTGRYLDRSSAEVFVEAKIELQEVNLCA